MASKFRLSEEERREFRAAVADARPLPAPPLRQAPKPPPRARFHRDDERQTLADSLNGAPEPGDVLAGGDSLLYAKPGVQHATLRKLRRGHFSIGAQLDLHGLGSDEARVALARFLQSARQRAVRCVCIIHGKGLRSGPRGPVLKHKLNHWLRQREEVIAFCSARPADGGTGAVYVLLSYR